MRPPSSSTTAAIPPACCAGADHGKFRPQRLSGRNASCRGARNAIVTLVGAIAIAFTIAIVDTAGRMLRMLLADADAEPIPYANALSLTVAITEPDIDAAR
jgi:hypothetical protein